MDTQTVGQHKIRMFLHYMVVDKMKAACAYKSMSAYWDE